MILTAFIGRGEAPPTLQFRSTFLTPPPHLYLSLSLPCSPFTATSISAWSCTSIGHLPPPPTRPPAPAPRRPAPAARQERAALRLRRRRPPVRRGHDARAESAGPPSRASPAAARRTSRGGVMRPTCGRRANRGRRVALSAAAEAAAQGLGRRRAGDALLCAQRAARGTPEPEEVQRPRVLAAAGCRGADNQLGQTPLRDRQRAATAWVRWEGEMHDSSGLEAWRAGGEACTAGTTRARSGCRAGGGTRRRRARPPSACGVACGAGLRPRGGGQMPAIGWMGQARMRCGRGDTPTSECVWVAVSTLRARGHARPRA